MRHKDCHSGREGDGTLRNERILIIDDDRAVHTYLRALLSNAGYKTYMALDALQGPMAVRQFHPDLIVLDLSMPGGGGPAVLQRLRTLQGMTHIPVLVYSNLDPERAEQLVPAEPGVALVPKPGTPEKLLQTIDSLLGHASA